MALQLCSSETSSRANSFSIDLSRSDNILPAADHLLRSISSSTLDFTFCTNVTSSDELPSMADDLFFNGKIIPTTQIKKIPATPSQFKPFPSPPPPLLTHPHQEFSDQPKLPFQETEEKQSTKSFWGFKRSSSCGTGYAHTLCPLPILSRSSSTGSSTSSKQSSTSSKEGSNNSKKQLSQKTLFSQKPPLKKSTYGSSSHGNRVNPVLNVHSANMFGLGSIFTGGKDKTKKK